MKILFKAHDRFLQHCRKDLNRRHRFASERVGFIAARAAQSKTGIVLFAEKYFPVDDNDYVNDRSVGAMMGQEAIRKGLEIALLNPVAMLHVHVHDHSGTPHFSRTDLREQPKYVPDFFKVRPEMPHGAVVLSQDEAAGRVWISPEEIHPIDEIAIVGSWTKWFKFKPFRIFR